MPPVSTFTSLSNRRRLSLRSAQRVPATVYAKKATAIKKRPLTLPESVKNSWKLASYTFRLLHPWKSQQPAVFFCETTYITSHATKLGRTLLYGFSQTENFVKYFLNFREHHENFALTFSRQFFIQDFQENLYKIFFKISEYFYAICNLIFVCQYYIIFLFIFFITCTCIMKLLTTILYIGIF